MYNDFKSLKYFNYFMKKIAIVDIMGGFGNQLFAICFGLQLQTNGFKVYYYFSDKKIAKDKEYNPSDRQLVINPKNFGIKKLQKFHIYLLKFFKKNYRIIFESEINTSLEKIFPDEYTFITSFNGQFQDCLLYENNKESIDNIILNDKVFKTTNSLVDKSNTMLSVRREFGPSSLDLSFYEKALLLCNIKDNTKLKIFSDDKLWVTKNKIFDECGYISSPSNKPEIVLKDFKMMINSKNFIVGNSTFSLFASLIGHDKDSIIVIEKNFYENIKNIKFLSENVHLI